MHKLVTNVAVPAVAVWGVIWLCGCNPYVAAISAASSTYDVASDVRPLAVQASDAEIEGKIKAALVTAPEQGTAELDVTSRNGVVVIAGVVPPGSSAGWAAVRIARETPGVRRVETFFVADRGSRVGDLEVTEKIKAAFVEDTRVSEAQVTVGVYGGHVVLIGVVSSWQIADAFVEDARRVNGVLSVRSYLQVE